MVQGEEPLTCPVLYVGEAYSNCFANVQLSS